MKLNTKIFDLTIITIILFCCAPKQDIDKKPKKITFIPTEISVCYLENMMDTFYFVPLATNKEFLIGHISELFFTDNDIIVADNSQGPIFVFDQQGNPKHKISARGRGPGQYSQMTNVFFDGEIKQFEILDNGSKKILFYSFSGDFLSDKKINNSRLASFRFTKNNGIYVFDRGQNNIDGMRISIYDETTMNFIKSYLPYLNKS